jgi:hypothetical protein
MPFAVFRKHQRKLLAVFAILAMLAFVLGDSLSGWVGGKGKGPGGGDAVVAELKWKTIRYSDLNPMRLQRQRANYFVAAVKDSQQMANYFGGTTTRDLVDALIYEHEADKLGIPVSAEIAMRFLRSQSGRAVSDRYFEEVFQRSSLADQVTDQQLLLEIANQCRIRTVQTLPLTADATPLDVFDTFKEQQEKVSVYAVPVRVEDYFDKVGTPTDSELQTVFESGKDRLPDPESPLPGFKIPHKTRFEMVIADLKTLTDEIQKALKPEEVREAYKTRAAEFPADPGELPTSLFAGAPDLTPHDSFPSVREQIAKKLAEEKARDQVDVKFDDFKNEVMRPFADKYYGLDSAEGEKPDANMPKPKPGDLVKNAAAKVGLTYESTPLVPMTTPELFGSINKSHPLTDNIFQTTPFAEIAFSPKTELFLPIELTDAVFRGEDGHRFLAWKIEDQPARVPSLEEVRTEVVNAWKIDKARPLAEAAAKTIADAAKKAGGGAKIRDAAGKLPVIPTVATPKTMPATDFRASMMGERKLAEIAELPHAGSDVRDAIFELGENSAEVAPDEAKKVYYVLTLRSREPADFDALYGFGASRGLYDEVSRESLVHMFVEWRQILRERAGLGANWVPPDGK